MEDFIRGGIQGEELAELNKFQIFLREMHLSYIVTGDRKSISPMFWLRNTNPMAAQYHWPPKLRLHQKYQQNLTSRYTSHIQPLYISILAISPTSRTLTSLSQHNSIGVILISWPCTSPPSQHIWE